MYQGYVRGTGNSAWAGSIARGLENRDLKWETTDTKNFGIDFGLFNNHLSGNVNYYYNETSDLLIYKELAPSVGLSSPILNVGKMRNTGIEIELNWNDHISDFTYTVGANLSWYPNWEMTRFKQARVVYNGAYLSSNTNENFRRVLTHEFGHFLNLAHTFNYDEKNFHDGCNKGFHGEPNPGDYVDDTPPADRQQMGPDDVNCLGQKTNWTNYMNYSYVRTSMFTKGQVERMVAALQDKSRACLWSDATLAKVFLSDTSRPRVVLAGKQELFPKDANGNYDITVALRVIGASAKQGALTAGTDFTVEGLPDGLTASAIGNGQTILLNVKGTVTLGADKKIYVTFQPSATTSSDCYVGRQPLTIGCDYVESEISTEIRRPVTTAAENRITWNSNGDITITTPKGARIAVHDVYGATLMGTHSNSGDITLALGGYGHGVYLIGVVSRQGAKTYKIAF